MDKIWFKKKRLIICFYLRKFGKGLFMRSWGLGLFFIAFLLLLSVVIPNFVGRLPIWNNWHKIYEIQGFSDLEANTIIQIGGYKTEVNENGSFELKFPSKSNTDIPVIISNGDTSFVIRVNFNGRVDQLSIFSK